MASTSTAGRGFLLGELWARIPSPVGVVLVGGVLFGLHHIFALLGLFPWPLALLFMSGTMLAGAVWTWMRVRGLSIIDCYVSHILADLAIMWIGWDLMQSVA